MRYRYETKPKSLIKKDFKKAEHNQDNPTYKTSGFEIFYTLIKDIRDIRDDLERIKKVIKIPEEE